MLFVAVAPAVAGGGVGLNHEAKTVPESIGAGHKLEAEIIGLMTSSCPRNKFNFARLAWRPMERSPAQQMHMQMEHRLSSAGSGVHHRAITISQFSLARQFRRHQCNLSQH